MPPPLSRVMLPDTLLKLRTNGPDGKVKKSGAVPPSPERLAVPAR
jgi:hypothetical protein